MPNYIHSCPNRGRNKNDTGWSAVYFDVYERQDRGLYYCHGKERETYGRISKP